MVPTFVVCLRLGLKNQTLAIRETCAGTISIILAWLVSGRVSLGGYPSSYVPWSPGWGTDWEDLLMTDWGTLWWQGSLAEEGEQREGPARRVRKDYVLHFVKFEACTEHFPDEKIR